VATMIVEPMLGDDERDAAVTVLQAVLDKRVLVEHDADLVRGALEGLTHARERPRTQVDQAPDLNQLGRFARQSVESRKAALANFPRSGTQRYAILAMFARRGSAGLTRDEVVALNTKGWPPNVVTPRIKELVEGGWLETKRDGGGNVVTRDTRAGQEAAVLVATARARTDLRNRGVR
jgi:hypothetical protein